MEFPIKCVRWALPALYICYFLAFSNNNCGVEASHKAFVQDVQKSVSSAVNLRPIDGSQCSENPNNGSANTGKVQHLGGLNTYITGPADSNISIIMISDVFGYEVPHIRDVADKIAAAGYYTVVPDFFRGNPYVQGQPFTPWLDKHTPEKGFEDAKRIVEALKSLGIAKIGVAGFCWGAKVDVLLAQYPYIQASVLAHPTYTTVPDIQGVKVPIAILGGQNDTLTPPNVVLDFEKALKAMPQIDSFVKIFPGAAHGWTIRYNETTAKLADEAHKDMLDWFAKHLKNNIEY